MTYRVQANKVTEVVLEVRRLKQDGGWAIGYERADGAFIIERYIEDPAVVALLEDMDERIRQLEDKLRTAIEDYDHWDLLGDDF